jgi:hypothetical protein
MTEIVTTAENDGTALTPFQRAAAWHSVPLHRPSLGGRRRIPHTCGSGGLHNAANHDPFGKYPMVGSFPACCARAASGHAAAAPPRSVMNSRRFH